MLLRRTKSHDFLYAGAVVPGPVEQHDLCAGGQVGDVALEEPLATLPVRGRGQGCDADDAGAEVFGDPLDRAALAGGVAALENHDNASAGGAGALLGLLHIVFLSARTR